MTSTGPFRVWSEKWQQWMNHLAVIGCDGHIHSFSVEIDDTGKVTHRVHDMTALDCRVDRNTGLKDVNGAAIYEGDVLGHVEQQLGDDVYVYVVDWDEDEVALVLRPLWEHDMPQLLGPAHNWVDVRNGRFKVIGNRHENPQLLTQ